MSKLKLVRIRIYSKISVIRNTSVPMESVCYSYNFFYNRWTFNAFRQIRTEKMFAIAEVLL